MVRMWLVASVLGGCQGDKLDLGAIWGDPTAANVVTMATSDDGLDVPRALAFNPIAANELWIVNRADDSVTVLSGDGLADSQHLIDPYAEHFMEEPSSIAFGAGGLFGTCQETRNTYNGQAPPDDFMGPTLWSADLATFA